MVTLLCHVLWWPDDLMARVMAKPTNQIVSARGGEAETEGKVRARPASCVYC